MATSNDEGRRKAVQYGDQRVERGHGGETHQIATGTGRRLTTQQGTVVSDDQNTLRAGERGPSALEDSHFRGRDQVPRPHPRGQGRTRPGLPAGPDRARQLLGLRLADARVDPHADVDHVRPGHPPLVPVHGGLRRAHLPAGQRQGPVDVRQVPLEAQGRAAVGGVERGGQDQRRRPGLPPAGPVGRHHRRRLPRVGARAAAVRRRVRRPVRVRHPGPDQDHSRGRGPGPPGRPAGPGPDSGQLLRRDRAGRVLHPEHRARHRLHQRPAAAGPELLLPRHSGDAAGRPELHPPAGQRAQVPHRALPAGRPHGHDERARPGQLRAELPRPARPA